MRFGGRDMGAYCPITIQLNRYQGEVDHDQDRLDAIQDAADRMEKWTVEYLIHRVPSDLEDELTRVLDEIAARFVETKVLL